MSIVTTCQDCFFARWEGDTQIGCDQHLIQKYIDNNIAVEAYNEKGNFYILPNHLCIAKVPTKFVQKKNIGTTVFDDVRVALQIKWQCIVFFDREDVNSTLDSISKQAIPPENVTIVCSPDCPTIPPKVAKWLKNRNFKTWRVMETANPELSKGNLIDMVLDKYSYQFYFVMDAGTVLPDDFIRDLNQTINEKLISFGIIKTYLGEMFATSVHKMFNGNSFGQTLEEKLIEGKCQDKIINLKS